jgi:hypothetical protein
MVTDDSELMTSGQNSDHLNQIQFSPSIKNEESEEEDEFDDENDETSTEDNESIIVDDADNKNENNDDIMSMNESVLDLPVDDTTAIQICLSTTETVLNSSGNRKKRMSSSSSLASLSGAATLNIESINQTEACVFYVLSQLSHADKPSPYLLGQFDAVVQCLLRYLKCARIRNPRALRILNRLSKNQNCFQSLVGGLFPFKIREILGDSVLSETSSAHALVKDAKLELEIEKEMSVYLSSNKVIYYISDNLLSNMYISAAHLIFFDVNQRTFL